MIKVLGSGLLALGAALLPGPALAKAPDATRCPPPEQPEGGEISRTEPIPVPPDLQSIVGTSRYNIAIALLNGKTLCRDTSWKDSLVDWKLSPDGRFLTYGWMGYETYGQDLVDRSGEGEIHEIGQPPVFSPSRRQFAAIDLNEAEIGTLTGLAIWRVTPTRVVAGPTIPELPQLGDWRIDGWGGEACLRLSSVPQNRFPSGSADPTGLRRDRFVARPIRGTWRLLPQTRANRCPAR